MGQIYDGRFRRSITLWFIGFCVTCLVYLMVVSLELNRLALHVLATAVAAYTMVVPRQFFGHETTSFKTKATHGPGYKKP